MLMDFVFQPFYNKKFTLLRQTFVKASKKSEFYLGKIGGKCDLVAKSGFSRISYFEAFLYSFRAKKPRFRTFYRLVNLLELFIYQTPSADEFLLVLLHYQNHLQ